MDQLFSQEAETSHSHHFVVVDLQQFGTESTMLLAKIRQLLLEVATMQRLRTCEHSSTARTQLWSLTDQSVDLLASDITEFGHGVEMLISGPSTSDPEVNNDNRLPSVLTSCLRILTSATTSATSGRVDFISRRIPRAHDLPTEFSPFFAHLEQHNVQFHYHNFLQSPFDDSEENQPENWEALLDSLATFRTP